MNRKVCKTSTSNQKQRGTVLLMVMLIVAVITGIAVNFTSSFQLSLARAEQRIGSAQLRQFWLSMERFAVWGLKQDLDDDLKNHKGVNDHLQELWSTLDAEAPFEGGFARAKLKDAQGRFNLNALAAARPQNYNANGSFAQRFNAEQQRFIRLLQTYPDEIIDASQAEQITEAVMDWLDADDNVAGIGGAESGYYLSQEPPHTAANQLFNSVTELRLVKGLRERKGLYKYLLDLVMVLPDSSSGLNINTASLPLLRSIGSATNNQPLSETDGQALADTRPPAPVSQGEAGESDQPIQIKDGYKDIQAFLQSTQVATLFGSDPQDQPLSRGLVTGSNYFLLSGEVQVGEAKRKVWSLVKRDNASGKVQATVVKRGTQYPL